MGLLENKETYNRYYGNFRGVDFSSDHTQVDKQRLAYAINMFRDYQSSQGQALETVAGFRRRVRLPENSEVYGIFNFSHKDGNGHKVDKVLIHAGTRLYIWANYPYSVNIEQTESILVPAPTVANGIRTFTQVLASNVYSVQTLTRTNGADQPFEYDSSTHTLTYVSSVLQESDSLIMTYKEGVLTTANAIFSSMNERKSTSFIFNNRLHIIDGKNYLVYDGVTIKSVLDDAYIPTTYMNIIPSGENADIGLEYEQRNILQPKFKHTFIADGETTVFALNECDLESVDEVKVYGTVMSTGYTVDLTKGEITFDTAPQKPQDAGYTQGYAGVEITASKDVKFAKVASLPDNQTVFESMSGATIPVSASQLITGCTIAAIYDNRVFLSGNPDFPNYIFFPSRNLTGYIDPSYFGILNYMQDGVGIAPITGMIAVADTLMVLKNDTQQDGSTYFHTGLETGKNINPKIYPSQQGLSGIGCLGACVNFLDDPIFISRLGVEAVGQLSVRNERANEHRSSLIDAKLVNMDLQSAVLAEWNGYLLVLVDGCIFMADSRQRYTHEIGVNQYEWYYLEGIGVYQGQYAQYKYATQIAEELVGCKVHYTPEGGSQVEVPLTLPDKVYFMNGNETKDLRGTIVNPPDDEGNETAQVFTEGVIVNIDGVDYTIGVYYTIHEVYDLYTGELKGYEALLCERNGEQTGGVFKKATTLRDMYDNIFFGTENGVVCSFNFDKRNSDGEIESRWYSFDDRTILSGCATKMDCCDVPALTKNTVKKSTVIKTKSFRNSSVKIKVRTNKKPYTQVARINTGRFTFEDMDFADFTFNTVDESLFMAREKEKHWVEKQYYLFSDEFCKPFALYYITFRYQIGGRFKS